MYVHFITFVINYYISNYCGVLKGSTIHMGLKSSVIMLKLKRETYKPNLECNVSIKAPNNYGIIAYVKRIKLRKLYDLEDSLEVSADNKNVSSFKWFGDNEEIVPKKGFISNPSRGEINVIFRSENFYHTLFAKGFGIVLTLFTMVNSKEICGQNSSLGFNCNNKICVDNMLECDGINNCINNADEINCRETSESMIGLIVFCTTILIMAVLIVVFVYKTDRQKRVDMARRFSKACINSGRRLSTIFSIETRHPPTPQFPYRYDSNGQDNIYRSVPIVYEPNEDKLNNDIINNCDDK